MFHKYAAKSLRSTLSDTSTPAIVNAQRANSIRLVTQGASDRRYSALPELVAIASRRCSSFFAEAAVLVLVFGILDFFLQRGRMEMGWVAGALVISVALLAASVATDFSARRWLGAHP